MKDFRSLEQKIRAMYEGKVPDNWEDNSKSKRAATAKKVANDAMDHDKTDKIIPHVPKITEAAKDDDNDADNKPKAKKSDNDGDADNMDAKEIKGGKTEVDLKPTTDDKNENEDSEDKASKSAKNKANKDIGQKGVKEMHNPTKNFGLSDSLVEAVRKVMSPVKEEAIDEATDSFHVRSVDHHGNDTMHGTHSSLDSAMSAAKKIKTGNGSIVDVVQTHNKANAKGYHKIKAFHNTSGKKFRPGDEDHIHPKHGLSSGGDHIDEATIGIDEGNPVNKIKKNSAAISIGADAARKGDERFNKKIRTSVAAKMLGRQIQKEEAIEEEQLDELSPKTLYSYGSKAHNQVIKTGMGLSKRQGGLRTKGVSLEDGKRKMANRKAGVELAHKKAQGKANEEVVAEGPTSPVVKSKDKYDVSDMVAKFKAKGGEVTKGKTAAAYGAKVPKRTKAMREDVELSADEMARIEAIIAEINL